jgi:HEAT repeat protein
VTGDEVVSAVLARETERVAAALRAGADADRPNEYGTTPLYCASVQGYHEIVRLLLEYGADPNLPGGGEDEGLPLCAAASWDHWETVQALLDGGADPDRAEGGGWTPLLWAAARGHLRSADLLLDAGARTGLADTHGATPLTLAAAYGAYGVAASLLDHGADPGRAGRDGATPLQIARAGIGSDVESELRELVSGGDRVVVVTRSHAADGTELISVEGRSPEGGGREASRQRGHAAIASLLEQALDVRPPVAELIGRAVAFREVDEDGETWWQVVRELQSRDDEATFAALIELCGAADPREREFAVDTLAQFGAASTRPYPERSLPVLRAMAPGEHDPGVLGSLLSAFGHHGDEGALPEVLDIIARTEGAHGAAAPIALAAVLPEDDKAGLAVLIGLTRDTSAEVRDWATTGLAGLAADTGQIRDALAARLCDEDLPTVAEAARGLAARGDRRAMDGVHRVLADSDDDYARALAVEAAEELGLEITEAP